MNGDERDGADDDDAFRNIMLRQEIRESAELTIPLLCLAPETRSQQKPQ